MLFELLCTHLGKELASNLKKKERLTETERIKFGNKSAIIHISHYQKTFGKLVNKQWTRIQQCRKNEEHNFKNSRCFRTKKVHYLLFWNFEMIRIVLILLFFQSKLYVRTRTIQLFFYIILTKQIKQFFFFFCKHYNEHLFLCLIVHYVIYGLYLYNILYVLENECWS